MCQLKLVTAETIYWKRSYLYRFTDKYHSESTSPPARFRLAISEKNLLLQVCFTIVAILRGIVKPNE